jgi:hypothetical protein
MDPDNLKQAWQTQISRTRLTIDADLLVSELRRNQQYFAAMIFWRDVREVGVSLLMVPVWIYLGIRQSPPWTWYLGVPALLWIAGYLLVDRIRHKRQPAGTGDPLRQHVASSLAEVEHQIWLLRNVFWWYLLPPALALLAFISQLAWHLRSGDWWTAFAVVGAVALLVLFVAGVYWLNLYAVRSLLEPRRRELETLLMSLADETPGAS